MMNSLTRMKKTRYKSPANAECQWHVKRAGTHAWQAASITGRVVRRDPKQNGDYSPDQRKVLHTGR